MRGYVIPWFKDCGTRAFPLGSWLCMCALSFFRNFLYRGKEESTQSYIFEMDRVHKEETRNISKWNIHPISGNNDCDAVTSAERSIRSIYFNTVMEIVNSLFAIEL